jgi:hypothetical protein
MLARFVVVVPFNIVVPNGAHFKLYSVEDDDYVVTFRPPVHTDQPLVAAADEATIGGEAAFIANGVVIDFRKDEFERRASAARGEVDGTVDPPSAVVLRVLNFFLAPAIRRARSNGASCRIIERRELAGPVPER